jgi:hypothetical protein
MVEQPHLDLRGRQRHNGEDSEDTGVLQVQSSKQAGPSSFSYYFILACLTQTSYLPEY